MYIDRKIPELKKRISFCPGITFIQEHSESNKCTFILPVRSKSDLRSFRPTPSEISLTYEIYFKMKYSFSDSCTGSVRAHLFNLKNTTDFIKFVGNAFFTLVI